MQTKTELDRPAPILIGADGMAMLALSTALILLSGGMTLLTAFCHVMWVACCACYDGTKGARILVLGMRLDSTGEPTPAYRKRLQRALELWPQAQSERHILENCQVPE